MCKFLPSDLLWIISYILILLLDRISLHVECQSILDIFLQQSSHPNTLVWVPFLISVFSMHFFSLFLDKKFTLASFCGSMYSPVGKFVALSHLRLSGFCYCLFESEVGIQLQLFRELFVFQPHYNSISDEIFLKIRVKLLKTSQSVNIVLASEIII